jgi:NADH-quinone oxidoreductase subunit N
MPELPPLAISPALPEIIVIAGAMALLMFGAFSGEQSARTTSWLAIAVLILALIVSQLGGGERRLAFYGMFVTEAFALFMKALVLIGSAVTILLAMHYNEDQRIARFEFPVLVLLSTAGMMVMISAHDLITLYVGLELQNLPLYVVASFNRDSVRSSEAGLKYFVLSSLSSGMLLYGVSLVYGFTGTTDFAELGKLMAGGAAPATGVIVGLVFVVVGLAFKVSAVPFHMWTPDVYEGAPTPVSMFFALAPKMAALGLFIRFMIVPFGPLVGEWRQVIVFLSIASMVFGAVAAVAQPNIKRLMAYSSIGHIGYALVGLAAATPAGIRGVLVYMAIYLFMNLGTWAVILCMRQNGKNLESISDLSGLGRSQPGLAFALAIFMFGMAGVPPTAGFFSKLYVFLAAIDAHLVGLAVIGVLASVVGAYYYLRVVKVMYFDEPFGVFDRPIVPELKGILILTAVVVLCFVLLPDPIVGGAEAAAAALFGK